MTDNISLASVPRSRHLGHMQDRAWCRALRGWGWSGLVSAASLEVDGTKGVMVKATYRWCREVGLGKYEPKGGWVTAQLCSKGPVSPVRKKARRHR